MRYLHSMIRVEDLDRSMDFYCNTLGMTEIRRMEFPDQKYTSVFLAAPRDVDAAHAKFAPTLELMYHWDPETRARETGPERRFGHLAYRVENIYEFCRTLQDAGITINKPPRDGFIAVFTTPDHIAVEVVQEGARLPPEEPWASMPDRH